MSRGSLPCPVFSFGFLRLVSPALRVAGHPVPLDQEPGDRDAGGSPDPGNAMVMTGPLSIAIPHAGPATLPARVSTFMRIASSP